MRRGALLGLLPVVWLGALLGCEKQDATRRTKDPDPVPAPVPLARDASTIDPHDPTCDVVIKVTTDGLWLGADQGVRCFKARIHGAPDLAWLEEELTALRTAIHEDCGSSLEIAAEPNVEYQDVVAAMDVAIKTRFIDVGLTEPTKLAIQFGLPATTPARCKTPTRVAPKPMPWRPAPPPSSVQDRLTSSPVVVISETTISVSGKDVNDRKEVMTVAQAKQGGDVLAPLLAALPKITTEGLVILQADEATDARVINRVVTTAKSAGYNNVLFAVKRR